MNEFFFRRLVAIILFAIMPLLASAQSSVMEVSWNGVSGSYSGLLVLYPNNRGTLKIKTFIAGVGLVWVTQDAVYSARTDAWGNITQYINCYNPRTVPYVPWAADNFVIFPNGNMYTQDSKGEWSTAIVATLIAANFWPHKLREYGLAR